MNKRIGFIGCGNMGTAILEGMVKSQQVLPDNILVYNRSEQSLVILCQTFGCRKAGSAQEVANEADILIIGVKPAMVVEILRLIKPVLRPAVILVSIAAGVTLATLEAALNQRQKVVRVMPNTPALVNAAMSSVTPNAYMTSTESDEIVALFQGVGEVALVPESLIHAVVGVSGSAPAYVFMFIEAMADAAVLGGMSREQAYQFAAQAVMGAAKMVLETGKHPAALKDMVCSPGGTTIAAVQMLEEKGFRAAVIAAIQSCMRQSEVMSCSY